MNRVLTGEKDGLLKDPDGNLVLEDGWRKVLESENVEGSRFRSNGLPEYQHEAELFRTHAEAFAHLNRMVRTKVKEAACVVQEDDTGHHKINPIERRGVALGQIRAFFKKIKSEIRNVSDINFHTVNTRTVVKRFLERRYGMTAYAEMVNNGPSCPKYVIEHLWDGRPCRCQESSQLSKIDPADNYNHVRLQ